MEPARPRDAAGSGPPGASDALAGFRPELLPPPFALHNTGAICYFNSFLQALAACTALSEAALARPDYMRQTRTGAALLAFFEACAALGGDPAGAGRLAGASADVLRALCADLAERRPWVRFGVGQESASEALVHTLDMLEPPPAAGGPAEESPLSRLFTHRYRCSTYCGGCRATVSVESDQGVQVNMFFLDSMRDPPATPAAFAATIRRHFSHTEGYACERCGAKGAAVRCHQIALVPEVLMCVFNLYRERRARYIPASLAFPAVGGGYHAFRLVAQVRHSGDLSGGHYWAYVLRRGGVYRANDACAPARVDGFDQSASTYLAFYHYLRHVPAEAQAPAATGEKGWAAEEA